MEDPTSRLRNKWSEKLNRKKFNLKQVTIAIVKTSIKKNAQIKLTEMWKSQMVENYPIKIDILEVNEGQRQTRSVSREDLVTNGHSQTNQSAFINDAAKIWNLAPLDIKKAKP